MTIAVAIIAFNKLELLQRIVSSLRTQTRKPDEIIVVNNGCTDGTAEWLAKQEALFVVNQSNSGSAGGFCSAMKIGYERKHDWILCLDDDAIPREDAIEKLLTTPYSVSSSTGFLSCRVVSPDNKT